MRRLALALALVASGCSFGLGSAAVGEWRPRTQVDAKVCVEDARGQCVAQRELSHPVPGRRFWGIILAVPTLGVAEVSRGATRDTALRLGTSAEYLRGKGRFALGLRASGLFDLAGDRSLSAGPILTPLGHLGLDGRWSLYGGLGFAPASRLVIDPDGSGPALPTLDLTSHRGLDGVVGLQFVLNRSQHEAAIVLSLEADRFWVRFDTETYQSDGLAFHLGIFL